MMLKNFKIISLLFVLTIVLCAYIFVWLALSPGPLKENKTIVIHKGSLLDVSSQAEREHLIKNKIYFWIIAEVVSYMKDLRYGEYEFKKNSSIWDIITVMSSGKFVQRSITIPEGYTTRQILNILEQEHHLEGGIAQNIKYDEGKLLPETYFFVHGTKKEDILNKMSDHMNNAVNDIWNQRDTRIPLQNKHELIVLASIIEKESKIDQDYHKIASVFVNRLRRNMKLEADPTTIYAITKGQFELNRSLTKSDLKINSLYNTYVSYGLPPTPIANPGIKSIKAAARPANTTYLYFVVKDCQGGHNFASNLKEHNFYVRRYRKLKCS